MKWKFSRGVTREIRENKTTANITTYMYTVRNEESRGKTQFKHHLENFKGHYRMIQNNTLSSEYLAH